MVIVGLLIELGGIALTVSGVMGIGKELFPALRFPQQRAFEWLRRMVRRKPRHHHVEARDSAVGIESAGEVRAQGTRGRPTDDAPLPEWNLYWESRLNNLDQRLDWLTEDMRKADMANATRIAQLTERFETAIARLEERLRVVVGGEGGRGLIRTWWGLIAIGAGAIFQVAGGLIG